MSITYRVIRSDRRTLALTIDERGALIARAPLRMPEREVVDFIRLKEKWILAKQAEARLRTERAQSLRWADGALFPYLGGELTLRLEPCRSAHLEGDTLVLPRSGDPATHARRWMRQRAEALIAPRVADWANQTGLSPKRLMWSTAQKRWGSMSSAGVMRLNLALLHCPTQAVDYVIVHELSHMRYPNHSPMFYACVRRYLPQADDIRRRMRDMVPYLTLVKEATRG